MIFFRFREFRVDPMDFALMFIDFISLSSMMPRLFLDFPVLLADLAAISFRIFFVCAPVFFDFFERTTPEPEREKTGWKHNV